ncbi:uncharacterized protein LOC142892028 isoform X2 [Nelusetta ayraudi]
MMFPDFPFDSKLKSFLPHQEVQKYLEQYCLAHHIRPHIKFSTVVENVTPVVEEAEGRKVWEVVSSDPLNRQKRELFDAVFVCSGHYSDPHIPDIPGIENFKGRVLHSHHYRYATPFSSQSVVILGANASGLDIAIELAKVGAQVILSHRKPCFTVPLPPEIKQSSPVTAVDEDGNIQFQDGSVATADVLMFCTGYNFSFPFLDGSQLGLDIQSHLVSPLYHFMIPPCFPSLFVIGICKIICPFPNFDCQVRFAMAVLDGSVALPSAAQMEDEVRRQQQEQLTKGIQQHHLLIMGQDQWEYCQTLARIAGFSPLPPVFRGLYEEVFRQRQVDPEEYRQLNYRVVSGSQFERIDS